MSFRNNLQSLRTERNMTQEQLAMLLGVSRQSVTKWEAERAYPEMDKLLKMCDIFECSLDELVKGDLSTRASAERTVVIPSSPPTDVCGYDEHKRMMAWKIPTGTAAIIIGCALPYLLGNITGHESTITTTPLFAICILTGILVGLIFIVPAAMTHAAFIKAHPYVEDFYTENDRARARKAFSGGLIAGLASIFVGISFFLVLEQHTETWGTFFLLLFCALGVWNIMHYGMLLARTNVAQYNKNVADELELEDIMNAQIESEIKNALISRQDQKKKRAAVYGCIMIVATIVGLTLMFAPLVSSPNPNTFEPEGTSMMWFWVAWPIGGLICAIVELLWNAFGKNE